MTDRPSVEDFHDWRNGACGRWFFDHYLPSRVTQMKAVWDNASWESGIASQDDLNSLKARAEALTNVRECEYDGILEDLEESR